MMLIKIYFNSLTGIAFQCALPIFFTCLMPDNILLVSGEALQLNGLMTSECYFDQQSLSTEWNCTLYSLILKLIK